MTVLPFLLNRINHYFRTTCLERNVKMSTVKNPSEELKKIMWVDLELTGLDIEKDHILEVACLLTDSKLNIIAEGPHLVLQQSEEILNSMNEWCIEHHGKSGLTEASLKSTLVLPHAENLLLEFAQKYVAEGVCPIAGNSVYMDRLFIRKHLPTFNNYFHYRIIDVSSVKELCRRWYPEEFKRTPRKQLTHRALDDIKETIKELQYYRESIFK